MERRMSNKSTTSQQDNTVCTIGGTIPAEEYGMDDPQKEILAVFYRTESGFEPVREWLKMMSKADRLIIGTDISTVEYGWPVGMPTCKSLGGGLWEVRSNLSGNGISRVLFSIQGGRMYLLNGFIKKSQKTPQSEIELDRKRLKDIVT
jgi:phage-related protein